MYIPLEIQKSFIDEIKEGKNIYLVKRVWNRLKSKYSLFSYADFMKIYSVVKDNHYARASSDYDGSELEQERIVEVWINNFKSILNTIDKDPDCYSLKIFILFIIDSIYDQYHGGNRIYMRNEKYYNTLWWRHKSHFIRTVPNFYKAFVILRKYGFYDVVPVEDRDLENLVITHKIWRRNDIIDYVDYGYITDPVLFDLMFLDSFREKIKLILIKSISS